MTELLKKSSKLQITLTSPSEHLVKIGTSVINACNCFLRGKDQLIEGSPESLDHSIQYFNKAIEVDPAHADAYGYLAFSHARKNFYVGYNDLAVSVKEA